MARLAAGKWALALLLALFLFAGSSRRAGAEELPCLKCHEDLTQGAHLHPAAAMGCGVCHQDPHAKPKAELSLVLQPPELCFQCHQQDIFTRKVQHPPAASGMCTTCHNPHSSPNPRLLRVGLPELCFQCHDPKPFNLKVRHAPVAKGSCLSCHEAHSAEVSGMIKAPIGDLCTSCHKPEASGRHVLAGLGLGDVHPLQGFPDPARAGLELSCLSCHQPHAARVSRLFVADAASPRKLCLVCHEKVRIPLN